MLEHSRNGVGTISQRGAGRVVSSPPRPVRPLTAPRMTLSELPRTLHERVLTMVRSFGKAGTLLLSRIAFAKVRSEDNEAVEMIERGQLHFS